MSAAPYQKLTFSYREVIKEEKKFLQHRRLKLNNGEQKENLDNLFGLALSGGGIRSAIINLGFLKYINECGLLKKADYISTVSGGGYTGSYIQTTLKNGAALNDSSLSARQKETETVADRMAASEVKQTNSLNPYPFEELFREERLEHLKKYGNYMTPGLGLMKKWNQFLLVVTYLSSLVMSWIGPFLAIISVYFFTSILANNFTNEVPLIGTGFNRILRLVAISGLLFLITLHFIFNVVKNYSLDVSLLIDKLKGGFLLIIFSSLFIFFSYIMILRFDQENLGLTNAEFLQLGLIVLLCFAGFFANPNALSLHRYYRKRLSDAFLHFGGRYKNVNLDKLSKIDGNITDFCAPYPLINTCLNLQAGHSDPSFQGAKSGDYFLLSPLFCGSKLSGYIKTAENGYYKHMTLPTAMSISAAAVNPGMGSYSSTVMSLMTTILNLRLGFWALSPKRVRQENELAQLNIAEVRKEMKSKEISASMKSLQAKKEAGQLSVDEEDVLYEYNRKKDLLEYRKFYPALFRSQKIIWWPKYFLYELFSGINTKHKMLNLSDGGHIENLAVYELLRRRCKLIIGIDAGADPKFSFADLQNLVVRARNELGIELNFREDQIPEQVIRPRPSTGYSRTHFAVADIYELTEKKGEKRKTGLFVYVKSSVTAPSRKKDISLQSKSYQYKTFHAQFPHEPTSDQFFDEAQWEAYYYLGYFIAQDVLKGRNQERKEAPATIDELYDFFNQYSHKDPAWFDPGKDQKE